MRSTPSHLVLALAAVLALPAAAGDPKEPAAPKKSETAAPAMRAHVDGASLRLDGTIKAWSKRTRASAA